ncbi:MAG: aminoacyl-histidine dipeptidase [Bacteroidetes bacterium]|nr:aminoacyl-histidine dipeptidase [Bacteroidota bacterium]
MTVQELQPQALWQHFAALNAVPRPSKHEEQVIAFVKSFGESLGLETLQDSVGNIIIRKPASPGMEHRKTILLQSHVDMVHQKNNETVFDFATQGIEMYVDGDWVKAKGTTLGADNGIGVASIMSILASKEIVHPPLEALFTIDEETGMTGALGLKAGLLHADIMLNLDTEDDDELTIGCAGGVDVTGVGDCEMEATPVGWAAFSISLNGLTGGHSGMDIIKGRGNANKLMNRVLWQAARQFGLRIASINGGGLRNAIPRESVAVVVLPVEKVSEFQNFVAQERTVLQAEYSSTDPQIQLAATTCAMPEMLVGQAFQRQFLNAIYALHNGIFRMSPDVDGLVQTSNNVAKITIGDGHFSVQCLTRSSVNSEKDELARSLQASLELTGATVSFTGSYPGWTPRPGTELLKIMVATYQECFQADPKVYACHAGLECGIIGANYPNMEMVSFGPNIKGAHSPEERCQISSVQKFWSFLLEVLAKVG